MTLEVCVWQNETQTINLVEKVYISACKTHFGCKPMDSNIMYAHENVSG